jgi:carboxyl-terminal processing protease
VANYFFNSFVKWNEVMGLGGNGSFLRHVRRHAAVVLISFSISMVASGRESSQAKGIPDIEEKYRSLETLARGLFFLENMYVDADKVTQDKLVQSALKGIVDKLDPHTMLMPKKAFNQLTIDTQGKFGGVGIIVSQERGRLIVVSPIEDTPAYKAGVKAGDEIIAIDDIDLKTMKSSDAVERMRGEPGSKMKLTVRRKDEAKPLEFVLVREIIKVRSVRSQALGSGIVMARITSFQENTASELEEELKKYPEIKGVVLDLRDNPGGLLDQAVRVSDMFIESGIIVSTVGRDPNRVEREFAHKRDTYSGFPIVAVVNGGSASASEIVAGALQDHERGLILGTTTFGKGSVQTLVSLPDGSGLKLTVARYYTPKDRSIQAKGIVPDIVVAREASKATAESGESNAKPKTEADLEGHIESKDLSDPGKRRGILQELDNWTAEMKEDNQLVSAYAYLKSYSVFDRRSRTTKSGTLPKSEVP